MSFFRPDSSLVFDLVASPNHGERAAGRAPDMILLHYTGMKDAQEALLRLCSEGSGVSSHYVVMEDGRIIQCVPESRRAWHAGESFWAGETDINSCSIGIEIVNPGHEFGYPDFGKRQIAAVIALCRGIAIRRGIPAHRVLAHSDVAPSRKMDPGEKFPWDVLYRSRVGHWTEPVPILPGPDFSLGDRGEIIELFQRQLSAYGYFVPTHGSFDMVTQDAVMAFQRHFRTEQVDGVMDSSTIMTLNTLVQTVPAWTPPPPEVQSMPAKPESRDTPMPAAMPLVAPAVTAAAAQDVLQKVDPLEFAAKLAAELAAEFKMKDPEDLPQDEPERQEESRIVAPDPEIEELLAALTLKPEAARETARVEPEIEQRPREDVAEIEIQVDEAGEEPLPEPLPPFQPPETAEDFPPDEAEDIIGEIEPGTEVLVFEPKPRPKKPKA
jgi:N-acetylmuramoyl-L-alanine amidase